MRFETRSGQEVEQTKECLTSRVEADEDFFGDAGLTYDQLRETLQDCKWEKRRVEDRRAKKGKKPRKGNKEKN